MHDFWSNDEVNMCFLCICLTLLCSFKNGTRRSCTFSNERVRQIERENRILLRKILTHGPSYTIGLNSKQQLAQVNYLHKTICFSVS